MIDRLIDIYEYNQDFNFYQLIASGLVLSHSGSYSDILDRFKILREYNEYFTSMLRVLFATPIAYGAGIDELNLRIEAIDRITKYLAINHKVITNEGENPENLIFFAARFAKEEILEQEEIDAMLLSLSKMDLVLKNDVLQAFEKAALPFADNKITNADYSAKSFASKVILPFKKLLELEGIADNDICPELSTIEDIIISFRKLGDENSLDPNLLISLKEVEGIFLMIESNLGIQLYDYDLHHTKLF